jgi:hypothetical protein
VPKSALPRKPRGRRHHRCEWHQVLGSVRLPFSSPDLTSFVLQAQASKAKIIGLAAGPRDSTNAIKIGGEFGIFEGGQQVPWDYYKVLQTIPGDQAFPRLEDEECPIAKKP